VSEYVFEVTLTCDIKSKKNNKVARFRRGRLIGLAENKQVQVSQQNAEHQIKLQRIKDHGVAAMLTTTDFPSTASLQLEVVFNKDLGTTNIKVLKIGDKPQRGPNGRKRDIQNQLALVCDALEKARVCENDSQFARIIIERVVQEKVR
jgi:Holliday junction resolvase RusA-like endonuclease